MDSDLAKAHLGLRMAFESVHIPAYNNHLCLENVHGNESPVVSVNRHNEDDDDELFIIYDSENLRKCSRQRTENCLPLYDPEAEGRALKKPRLDNSTSTESKSKTAKQRDKLIKEISEKSLELRPPSLFANDQPGTQSSCMTHSTIVDDSGFGETRRQKDSQEKAEVTTGNVGLDSSKYGESQTRYNTNGEISSFRSSPTNDDQSESQATHFSGAEDNNFDTRLELQFGNAPETEAPSVRLLALSTSRISTDNVKSLSSIRLLFEVLESETLVAQYTTRSTWYGTIGKEAVDAFLQLSDCTCAEQIAEHCRTEAVKSIKKVYERYLKSSNYRALSTDSQCSDHFSIFLTLCDSESICEEFVKFFISRLITPKSMEDLDDPKLITSCSTERRQALFTLMLLKNVLTKYTKTAEKYDRESNACSARCMSADRSHRIQSKNQRRDMKWLKQLNEYVVKNCLNFPALVDIGTKCIVLLKKRTSLQTPL